MYFFKGQSVMFKSSMDRGREVFPFRVGTLERFLPTPRIQTIFDAKAKRTRHFRVPVALVTDANGMQLIIDQRCVKPMSLIALP